MMSAIVAKPRDGSPRRALGALLAFVAIALLILVLTTALPR